MATYTYRDEIAARRRDAQAIVDRAKGREFTRAEEAQLDEIEAESEGVPKQYLADFANLSQWIQSEMDFGVRVALEQQILVGGGTPPELPGLIPALGTAMGPGNLIVLVRQAIAQLEMIGVTPTGLVVNPEDSAEIDLLTDDAGAYFGRGPFETGPSVLWSLPRASAPGLARGQCILGDFRELILFEREQINLSWSDSHKDYFQRNLVAFLVEGRYGIGLLAPHAFKLIDASQIGPPPPAPEPESRTPTRRAVDAVNHHPPPWRVGRGSGSQAGGNRPGGSLTWLWVAGRTCRWW